MALQQQRMVHDLIEAVKLKRQKRPNRKAILKLSLSLFCAFIPANRIFASSVRCRRLGHHFHQPRQQAPKKRAICATRLSELSKRRSVVQTCKAWIHLPHILLIESDSGRRVQEIEFANYKRNIISYNPPLIDDDGDIIEDEDELEDGEVSPMEDNIYEDIKLEGESDR